MKIIKNVQHACPIDFKIVIWNIYHLNAVCFIYKQAEKDPKKAKGAQKWLVVHINLHVVDHKTQDFVHICIFLLHLLSDAFANIYLFLCSMKSTMTLSRDPCQYKVFNKICLIIFASHGKCSLQFYFENCRNPI